MSIFRRPSDNYRYTDPRSHIDERVLEQGINQKGEHYDRRVHFQNGYRELLDIVAGLQKDVKRINQCLTLDGARAYASTKKNWSAIEEDITGPSGKPDGIKEVLVFDSKGNLKIVNGYTLAQSSYPYRKFYRKSYPTKEARQGHPYGKYLDKVREIRWNSAENKVQYETPIDDPEFKGLQPRPSAKQVYKELLFQPMYDWAKLEMKANGVEPMVMARLYNKALSEAYDHHVAGQVLAQEFGEELDYGHVPAKVIRKFKASDEFKDRCFEWVLNILTTPRDWSSTSLEIEWIIEWYVNDLGRLQARDEEGDPIQAPPPAADHPSQGNYEQRMEALNSIQEQVNNRAAELGVEAPVVNRPPLIGEGEEAPPPPPLPDEDHDYLA